MLTSQFRNFNRVSGSAGVVSPGDLHPKSLWGTCPPKRAPRGMGLKQNYFIVVLAHSFHGRLQRIHIPHRFVYGAFGALGVAMLLMLSVVGSYARMAWKVA